MASPLEATALAAAVPMAAIGTRPPVVEDGRDYRLGPGAEGLAEVALTARERASLRLGARGLAGSSASMAWTGTRPWGSCGHRRSSGSSATTGSASRRVSRGRRSTRRACRSAPEVGGRSVSSTSSPACTRHATSAAARWRSGDTAPSVRSPPAAGCPARGASDNAAIRLALPAGFALATRAPRERDDRGCPPHAVPAPVRRSMLPHEHGAWGQLAMPLLTALAIGRPTVAALLLTAAVVLAFVAHEPLLVLLGQRGRRAIQEDGARARRWLAATGGLARAPARPGSRSRRALARLALVRARGARGRSSRCSCWRRLEKTTAGEIIVAAALASAGSRRRARRRTRAARAALAARSRGSSRSRPRRSAVQVILVRVRSKGARDPGRLHAVLAAGVAALAFALVGAGLPAALGWAVLPTALFSVVVCLGRFSPKRLRELGWALVGSSLVTLVVLVVGLR